MPPCITIGQSGTTFNFSPKKNQIMTKFTQVLIKKGKSPYVFSFLEKQNNNF